MRLSSRKAYGARSRFTNESSATRTRSASLQQAHVRVASGPAPPEEGLSDEFGSLCDAQLVLLQCMAVTRVRSSVYLRTSESLRRRSMRLKKVAHFPYGDAREAHTWEDVPDALLADDLLERSLTHESAISLPESGSVVMPLVHGSLLLGLLVVEPEDIQAAAPTLFTDEEQANVRLIARTLASAATLEMRSDLLAKQSEKKSQLLANLVGQFRGSLDALKGLGSMLVPRMEDDDPSKDMASGILSQGDRLQEVVSQLEYVLHPGSYSSRVASNSAPNVSAWLPERSPPKSTRYLDASNLQPAAVREAESAPVSMERGYYNLEPSRKPSRRPGKSQIKSSCDLQSVLSPLLATATPVAMSSDVSILAVGGAGPEPLTVDIGIPEKVLTRVLSNVIDAAMLHVPKGGRIEVSALDGPGPCVSIQVAFTGSNWNDLPTTFESVTAKRNIVIAQSQVEAENGTLTVQSPFPDACILDDDMLCQGTMITIRVPVGPVKQLPKPIRIGAEN